MNWKGFVPLQDYSRERISEFEMIHAERKEALNQLARNILDDINSHRRAKIIFICTHNSRRSHLGHLWAQMAAAYYEVKGIACYSGGTEATAFNPRAVNALMNAGMKISRPDDIPNPVYRITFPDLDGEVISAFSKKYEDPPNPTRGFIAVMTCSDADEACPIVYGADSRHTIPYDDPKEFDGSPEESAMYAERCRQISREMFYLFSRI